MKRARRHFGFPFTNAQASGTLALCACLSTALASQAQTTRTLLDKSLNAQRIALLEINTKGIVYTEATGLVRSASFDEVAAISTDRASVAPTPWLELTDGQRLTGSLTSNRENPDELFWTNPTFGVMRISLDEIRSITLDPAVDIEFENTTGDDWIALRNGDVLTGFIEHVGDSIGIDAGSGIVRIPIDRLAAAHFANEPTAREGMFIWLANGTVARVASLQSNRNMIEATRSLVSTETEANQIAESHIFPLNSLVAIIPDAGSFHPLASLKLTASTAPSHRRWSPHPHIGSQRSQPLDTAEIEIPGPMTLSWALPDNSHLVTFEAVLPDRDRIWGNCTISVTAHVAGQRVDVAQTWLSSDTPVATINAQLPNGASEVSITLGEGRFGPAQDEAILRSAIVLTNP